jgi:hypothetical protein
MFSELKRGISLGAKYGIRGLAKYTDRSVETPELDESAMLNPVGVVISVAGVIICLYISAIVVASLSKTIYTANATGGNITGMGLPAAWNTTVINLDTSANSGFILAGIMPIAIIGTGILALIISAFALQ